MLFGQQLLKKRHHLRAAHANCIEVTFLVSEFWKLMPCSHRFDLSYSFAVIPIRVLVSQVKPSYLAKVRRSDCEASS